MTEEIIIDGVNVAGCMDYKEVEYKERPICMNYYNHLPKPPKETEWQYCAGNKNCYYKQLKRLEIEIEKLKGVDGSVHPDSAYYKITRLEQENKELKEWKDKVVKLFESACRCKYLNEETDICSYTNEKCININKCAYKYQELSDTYRSALEEIRNYCDRIEQGSVIGTQDCLINSIKNITKEVLNA